MVKTEPPSLLRSNAGRNIPAAPGRHHRNARFMCSVVGKINIARKSAGVLLEDSNPRVDHHNYMFVCMHEETVKCIFQGCFMSQHLILLEEGGINSRQRKHIREHVEPSSVVNTTSRGLGFSPLPKLFFRPWRGEFGRSSGDVMTGSVYVRVHSFMNQASQVEHRVLLCFYLIDAGNFRQHEHKNLAISVFLPPLHSAPS